MERAGIAPRTTVGLSVPLSSAIPDSDRRRALSRRFVAADCKTIDHYRSRAHNSAAVDGAKKGSGSTDAPPLGRAQTALAATLLFTMPRCFISDDRKRDILRVRRYHLCAETAHILEISVSTVTCTQQCARTSGRVSHPALVPGRRRIFDQPRYHSE